MRNIQAHNVSIGKDVYIEPSATIRGVDGKAANIEIGDHVYIGESVQIICNEFSIGDYSKIHHHTNIHGYKPCKIGHNAWIGQYSIIDSVGGVTIGNNCGIGAHSQLWSHIKYGDTLAGCRFLSDSELVVGDDVWFVGHCIVSPVNVESKSMALAGSVVTSDMEENHIYAGTPAKSISEKVGFQFNEIPLEQKYDILKNHLDSIFGQSNIKIVRSESEVNFNDDTSYFNVADRKYKKTLSEDEVKFMKYLLPEKGKFVPY